MAKSTTHYACQSCGASHPKWSGRCEACGNWNTLVEEVTAAGPPKGLGGTLKRKSGAPGAIEFVAMKGIEPALPRRMSGIGEFDRVVGGGLVPGSAVLVGGDPGIGKSTLLLQAVCLLAKQYKTTYISGEEA